MKKTIQIRRGLQVPISGLPLQQISNVRTPRHVALLGDDYIGLKPTMHAKIGDLVQKGQLLFEDKNNRGVRFTSPATGTVKAVERGAKRKFESIVIEVDQDSQAQKTFDVFEQDNLQRLDVARVRQQLVHAKKHADRLQVCNYGISPALCALSVTLCRPRLSH